MVDQIDFSPNITVDKLFPTINLDKLRKTITKIENCIKNGNLNNIELFSSHKRLDVEVHSNEFLLMYTDIKTKLEKRGLTGTYRITEKNAVNNSILYSYMLSITF